MMIAILNGTLSPLSADRTATGMGDDKASALAYVTREHFENLRKAAPRGRFFRVVDPMTPLEERIEDLLSPVIEGEGFELVRLRLSGAKTKTLQIMAERPDGTMTAEDCARLSRAMNPVLEEVDPIADQYVLEVSSPGIDRPLTRLKDYERWEGFEAKLELKQPAEGQKRFRGTLAGVEDGDVLFDIDGEEETAVIPFGLIASGKLMLTDDLVTESLRRAKRDGANDEAVDSEGDTP